MSPVTIDQAITALFERMYRMPANVTRSQFRQGMRRIRMIHLASAGLWIGFAWFAEQMQRLAA